MDRFIETLERYYRSLDQERDWDFFLNLADYVNLLKELPIQDIVEKIREGEVQIREDLAKQEKLAVDELQGIKNEILKLIDKKKMKKSAALKEAITKLKDYEEGTIHPTYYLSTRIEEGLDGIIKVLQEEGQERILKELFPSKKDGERVYIYQFSAALISRQGLSTIYSEKAKTELWGTYRKLLLVPNTIFDGKKRLAELERKGEENEDIKKLVEEMDIIKSNSTPYNDTSFVFSRVRMPGEISNNKQSEKFSSSSDERIHEFRRDDYNTYATRFHNYLLKEMSREKATPSVQSKNGFSFDNDILSYQGKEIVVSKTKNSRPYFLLKTILKNPKALWNYDELWQDLFSTDYEPKKWKQIYNAAHDLNEKIAIVTGVSDFLELSKTTIKINQKYT